MHFVEAKALLTRHNGMNLYRGCAHGCVYCDSRSDCYRFTHPFEDIEVKQNAPALLEDILKKRRKRIVISTGSMSDPYQPCEQELQLTRRCLELLDRYGFGASVITKSDLVLRDLDLLKDIGSVYLGSLSKILTCIGKCCCVHDGCPSCSLPDTTCYIDGSERFRHSHEVDA